MITVNVNKRESKPTPIQTKETTVRGYKYQKRDRYAFEDTRMNINERDL